MALTLAMVLVAPAPPATAYVNPYGRYIVMSYARGDDCLTVPFNGVPGTYVIRSFCYGQPNQVWHFDKIGTFGSDPVFVIRATHRGRASNGEYVDCLDLPNSEVFTGRPLQTWHCNGGLAQMWVQTQVGWYGTTPVFQYRSMVDPYSGWVLTFNNNDVYPHMVMAPWTASDYQMFWQSWQGD